MFRSFIVAMPFAAACALLTPGCALDECADDSCAETDETLSDDGDTGQVQQAYTVQKYKKFYVSNPPSSANNYTRKAYALRVKATIPAGGKITGMHIFDMNGYYAMIDIACPGTTSCTATKNLPGGCRNYGTVPVLVDYTYDSASPKTPSLNYWFYDCK